MSRKKKATSETHLKELYLKHVEVLKYNPDHWNNLQTPLKDFQEGLRSIVVDPHLSDENPLEAMKQRFIGAGISDYFLRMLLAGILDDAPRFFPVMLEMEQVRSWMVEKDGYPLFLFKAEGQRPLFLYIFLQYSDNAIMRSLDQAIDCILSLKDVKWQEYRPHDPVLVKLDIEDLHPIREDMVLVGVQFSAGKTRIRQAVKELLGKYTPRDTEPTPKFSSGTWRSNYEIYSLHKDSGFTFKETATKLNKKESTVKSAYQRIYKHIDQTPEYGTKETRGELCVNIADRSPMPLQDAERKYARAEMLGGSGNKMALSDAYEDEEATFYDWRAELAESGKAFENWRKRFGQSIECWDCKRVPGSVVCSGCNQAIERKYPSRGLKRWYIEPGKAVKRAKPLESRSPYPLKSEKEPAHYIEIFELVKTQHLRPAREQELVLQAEHIENHGTVRSSPWQAPKPEDGGKDWIVPRPSFVLRKDEIESRLIDAIDLQARKSHHPY